MIDSGIYKQLQRVISPLLHSIDPAGLGGADGEYDREVDQLIRIVMEDRRSPSEDEIRSIFLRNYETVTITPDELQKVRATIDDLIKSI